MEYWRKKSWNVAKREKKKEKNVSQNRKSTFEGKLRGGEGFYFYEQKKYSSHKGQTFIFDECRLMINLDFLSRISLFTFFLSSKLCKTTWNVWPFNKMQFPSYKIMSPFYNQYVLLTFICIIRHWDCKKMYFSWKSKIQNNPLNFFKNELWKNG